MEDIKSLYLQAAKPGASNRVIDEYTSAINTLLESNPRGYIANAEYIISSSIGSNTVKPFVEKWGLPITVYEPLLYDVNHIIEHGTKLGKNVDAQVAVKEYLESYMAPYRGCITAFHYMNDPHRQKYIHTYYGVNENGVQNRLLAAGMLKAFGEAAIPDMFITVDKMDGDKRQNGINALMNHLNSKYASRTSRNAQLLHECAKCVGINDNMYPTMESAVNDIIERNNQLIRESVLAGYDEPAPEYTVEDVEQILEYAKFLEFKMCSAENPGEMYNQINDLYSMIDGYVTESGEINIDAYEDDMSFDDVEEFDEKSHRNLKHDFRLAINVADGHPIKIVYSLKNIIFDKYDDNHHTYSLLTDEDVTSKRARMREQRTIVKTGNADHKSKGQKVLAIEDIVTGKRLRDTVTCMGTFSVNGVRDFDKVAKNGTLAKSLKKLGTKTFVIKEGDVDNHSSYKSTVWNGDVTRVQLKKYEEEHHSLSELINGLNHHISVSEPERYRRGMNARETKVNLEYDAIDMGPIIDELAKLNAIYADVQKMDKFSQISKMPKNQSQFDSWMKNAVKIVDEYQRYAMKMVPVIRSSAKTLRKIDKDGKLWKEIIKGKNRVSNMYHDTADNSFVRTPTQITGNIMLIINTANRMVDRTMKSIDKVLASASKIKVSSDSVSNWKTKRDSIKKRIEKSGKHINEVRNSVYRMDYNVNEAVDEFDEDMSLMNTRNKKTGDIPAYLRQNHNIGYGEDDDIRHTNKTSSNEPAPEYRDIEDQYRRPSATDTSPVEPENEPEEEIEKDEPAHGVNNYYYYTYHDSFNKNSNSFNKDHSVSNIHRDNSHITNDNSMVRNTNVDRTDRSYNKRVNSDNNVYHGDSKDDPDDEEDHTAEKDESSVDVAMMCGPLDYDDIVTESDEPEKPESDHPIKDAMLDIDRKLTKHQQAAKQAVQNVQNAGRAIAKPFKRTAGWVTNILADWKDKDENQIKEKLVDPHARSNLFSAIRAAIVGGALFKAGLLLNPIFLFLGATKMIDTKNKKFRLRNEIIGELKTEIEIIDRKIEDAARAEDDKAKYQLMRLKNEMQKKLLRVGGTPDIKKIL